jgi:hypothetical protein
MASKVFVDVIVRIDADAKKTPLFILWEDGRRFKIERVLDMRRAASQKAGGVGDRYTCEVKGKPIYLFDEENHWFVEGKDE